ncbi:MAG: hypothetical protein GEU68_14715 [Actinobacteria bacterium]|nr:hypothetical protein [Actinomycetota bacterium]
MSTGPYPPSRTRAGAGPHPAGPSASPANYRKGKGVRFFFGAYDVAKDQLNGRWYARKTGADILHFFRWVRRRYKEEGCIYLIMDNLKAHFTEDIRNWAKDNDVELAPIPTYASWLNLIEVEFRHINEFVMSNSDYQSHQEIEIACSAYLRRRNRDARRNFEQRRAEKEARRKRRARARRRARAA